MTPNLSEPGRFEDVWSDAKLQAAKRDEEKVKMTEVELEQMPLESLLYYVLAGEGRIKQGPAQTPGRRFVISLRAEPV